MWEETDRQTKREGGVATVEQASEGFDHTNEKKRECPLKPKA